ncbi:MAG: fibronectin type III domain-containing protein [Candidatus Angelobacter sp.]
MKRTLTLLGLSLMLLATVAFAQRRMDEASERAVRIIEGPRIDNITGHSATIDWTTSSAGANHVRYRVAGSNQPWKSAYHQGGGTHHSLQLTGLEPGRTYEWQILTRDGDLRKGGQFQTPGHGDRDRDHDHDRDHDRR